MAELENSVGARILAPVSPAADFIGRRPELEQLWDGIADAAGGRGRCFLIAGDPGIGKTRLADELSHAAAGHGVLALWGRCWEGGGAPEFWPWTQVLRACRDAGVAAAHLEHLGPARTLIDGESPAVPPAAAAPEQTRFRLFDAVATFLKHVAKQQPLAVILDDLHDADTDSLLLLQFLARELRQMRVVIVGTYREADARRSRAASDLLSRIGRDSTHVPLRGLDAGEVGALIEHVLVRTRGATATAPPAAFASTIQRITEGNPFFVDGIVRVLAAEGQIPAAGGDAPWIVVPEHVRDAVRRRVQPLSPPALRLLGIAAVMGREFDTRVVEHVWRTEGATEAALDLLRDLARDGVVAPVAASLHRFSFAHALIRETLYDDLPPERRAAAHAGIARGLAGLSGEAPGARTAEIAHHYYCAVPAGCAAEALDAALAAAAHATRLSAYDEGVRQRERALEVFDALPPAVDAVAHERQRCELLLGLGQALNGAGNRQRAKEVFREASRCAHGLGDAEALSRAALGYGGDWLGYSEVANWDTPAGPFDDTLATLLTDALAALGAGNGPLRARLLSRLAVERYFSAPWEEREALVAEAIPLARARGDRSILSTVLAEACVALTAPHNVRERLAMAREVVGLAQATGQVMAEAAGRAFSVECLFGLGEVDAVTLEIEALARFAERCKQPAVAWAVGHCRTLVALLAGHFDEAERLARETLAIGRRAQRPALMAYTLQIVALRREQGRLAELTDTFQLWKVLADQYPDVASIRTALAFVCGELGRDDEARAEFEVLAARDFAGVPSNVVWLPSMIELTEVCVHLRDASRAAVLYDLLLPYERQNAVGLYCTASWGCTGRSLGMLAALVGRWDEAQRHFELALERNHALGARIWMAHTQLGYAAMRLARDAAGDRDAAMSLLRAAHATAQAAGMSPVAAAASESLRALGVEPGDAAAAAVAPRPAAAASPSAPRVSPVEAPARLRHEGEYWTFDFAGATVRLRHTAGVSYLAALLRQPGREVHAIELVRAGAGRAADDGPGAEVANSDAGEMLDPKAKAAYRQRLADLREELEEAQERNDLGRADALQGEIDYLTHELARAVGLGGRDRRAGSHAERARINVTRAIATVLKRIGAQHAPLRDHLAATIHTGTFCSYSPDPRLPVEWDVD